MGNKTFGGLAGFNKVLDETKIYRDRVLADGGTLMDFDKTNDMLRLLKRLNLYDNMVFGMSADYGLKLDENSLVDKAYDISSEDNDASQTNAIYRPKKISDSIEFGTNETDLVTNPTKATKLNFPTASNYSLEMGTGSITVLFWLNTGTFTGTSGTVFMCHAGGGNRGYGIRKFGSNNVMVSELMTILADSSTPRRSTKSSFFTSDGLNVWQNFAFVGDHNNKSARFYRYGEVYGTENTYDEWGNHNVQSYTWTPSIGTYWTNYAWPLVGKLDKLMVIKQALTPAQITAIYNATKDKYEVE